MVMAAKTIGSLKGMVALVTGGASGLGKATVERFVREGAKVVALDLPTSTVQEVANKINNESGDNICIGVPADICEEDDVKQALAITSQTYGKLDVLVNCAGIGTAMKTYNHNKKKPHHLHSFKEVMRVNVVGTFLMTSNAAALMAENTPIDEQRGVIINTSSIAAFDGQIGQVAYSASKGAIAAMTLPLARDLSEYGIRVCTIAPGLFDTPLLDKLPPKVKHHLAGLAPFPRRLGNVDEFAHFAQCIVENPMLNGEVIRLDAAIRMLP